MTRFNMEHVPASVPRSAVRTTPPGAWWQHHYDARGPRSLAEKRQLVQKWRADHLEGFTEHFPGRLAELETLIQACIDRGIRPVLVEMPLNAVAVADDMDDVLGTYRQGCTDLAAEYDIPYLDFVDELGLPSGDFYDLWHLLPDGRARWQSRLTRELVREDLLRAGRPPPPPGTHSVHIVGAVLEGSHAPSRFVRPSRARLRRRDRRGRAGHRGAHARRADEAQGVRLLQVYVDDYAAEHGFVYPAAATVKKGGGLTAPVWPVNPWTGRPLFSGLARGAYTYSVAPDGQTYALSGRLSSGHVVLTGATPDWLKDERAAEGDVAAARGPGGGAGRPRHQGLRRAVRDALQRDGAGSQRGLRHRRRRPVVPVLAANPYTGQPMATGFQPGDFSYATGVDGVSYSLWVMSSAE